MANIEGNRVAVSEDTHPGTIEERKKEPAVFEGRTVKVMKLFELVFNNFDQVSRHKTRMSYSAYVFFPNFMVSYLEC